MSETTEHLDEMARLRARNPLSPSIGRIVLYCATVGDDGEPSRDEMWAAIVTRVYPGGHVDLCLFPPCGSGYVSDKRPASGQRDIGAVKFSGTPTPGTWSWPPRV